MVLTSRKTLLAELMTSTKQILKTNKKDHARTLCTAKEEDYVSQTPSTITRILLDFIIHDYANVISFYFIN